MNFRLPSRTIEGMDIKVHECLEEANPNGLIVTLFQDDDGQVRGWFIGPMVNLDGSLQVLHRAPNDSVLGAIAIIQAYDLSQRFDVEMSIVDPDNLWTWLSADDGI